MAAAARARIIADPGPEFFIGKRFWQGCPTIEKSPGGVLYAGWYSGGMMEPSPDNYNLLVRSSDNGFSWSPEPLLVIAGTPEAGKIVIDIELWLDPAGKLWVFWVERDCQLNKYHPEHLALFAICCENPDAKELRWSSPRFITHGFLRCKPVVLSDGRWYLPAYDWTDENYCFCVSDDQGKSFSRCAAGKKVSTDFDESMFFETSPGEIHLYARSMAGYIAESVSTDNGKSWSDGGSCGINAPASRFFVRRLRSGNLLLIHNDCVQGRTNMRARVSADNGRSWSAGLLLDDSENISYPEAVEVDDGSIVVIYDHGRTLQREILTARITEKEILDGKLESSPFSMSFLRHIISKAPVPEAEFYREKYAEAVEWMRKTVTFWDAR